MLETRVYPIGDLLAASDAKNKGDRYEALVETIASDRRRVVEEARLNPGIPAQQRAGRPSAAGSAPERRGRVVAASSRAGDGRGERAQVKPEPEVASGSPQQVNGAESQNVKGKSQNAK